MAKRCIYCSAELPESFPIDVCKRCGIGVWGEKMFNAIVSGINEEREKGNMELGRVSEKELEELKKKELTPENFVERQIISAPHKTKIANEPHISQKPSDFIEIEENKIREMPFKNEIEQFPEQDVDTLVFN